MKKKKLAAILATLSMASSTVGCSIVATKDPPGIHVGPPMEMDGMYDYSTSLITYGKQDYEKIRASVVCLRNTTTYERINKKGEVEATFIAEAHGTGFVYKQKNGLYFIATNHHVADGFPEQAYGYTKGKVEITIVDNANDQNSNDDITLDLLVKNWELDMAVLKTGHQLPVYPYAVGNSSELKEGHVVRVEGYPLAVAKLTTEGIVSGRTTDIDGGEEINLLHDFIIDAAVNPGNSGSPVFALRDGRFEWVGQVHAGVSGAEGLKFAVKINDFKPLLEEAEKIAFGN